MPRTKGGTVGPKAMQLVVRLNPQLDADVRAAAGGLGIDVSNLVRMVLTEHIAEYIGRGLSARKRATVARENVPSPSEPDAAAPPVRFLDIGSSDDGVGG